MYECICLSIGVNVYVFVCSCVYICACVCVFVFSHASAGAQGTCSGQRITFRCKSPPFHLVRDSLLTAEDAGLAGPRASNCPVGSAEITEMCAIISSSYVASADSNSDPQACAASTSNH